MLNAPGSDSIHWIKDKISVSDPIDQTSSDPVDESDLVRHTRSGSRINKPDLYAPTMLANLGYNQK